uniref:Neurotransmitter-gated ion-channel ligand-binding domain-containing protein n=1 Tax=Romanomermis culicivorax TaxID=13658 RepID=A0A915IU48_ROMCU
MMINCESTTNAVKENDIIKTLLTNYGDPSILPDDVRPVDVRIEAFILSNPILLNRGTSGASMVEIDNMWIIQRWLDRRLNFEALNFKKVNITFPYEKMWQIWTPQISTVNDIKFEIRRSPTPNVYASIFSNGTVLLSYRPLVQLPCRT